MRVSEVNAVMIYAADPPRMAEWYAQFLGIQTTFNPSDRCYYGDIAPGFHFGIYPAKDRQRPPGGNVMVNYRVNDFDEFLKHLKKLGVEIIDTQDEPYGQFAHVTDCEGNPIEIWAEKQGTACP